ncbi:uncharacterized protein MELLADRAFT_49675 [Melampsora larici-populina 98AG31]|uniref:FAD-binding PCMH-type domain-containing protein n=1 Tax=Melampsora larici-populina (strain 98AG31 / pathotype 3-4-7) TaxID=747676 RepID=F4RXB7_MELLP|nr:uncharacterized protein MELLADRAFT_49675 [Melampsora larici-populina 98AG31]EGG03015.1 hypothetical protein MELLADRAFT_49675 [Melampsora larici-populina 98AG31]
MKNIQINNNLRSKLYQLSNSSHSIRTTIFKSNQSTHHPIKLISSSTNPRPCLLPQSNHLNLHFKSIVNTRYFTCGSKPLAKSYEPKRGPYKSITLDDINQFRKILNRPGSVLSSLENDPDRIHQSDLDVFNHDWMGKYKGQSKVVLKPKSTEEVSKIVGYCVKERLAICPQGGNTGLVGGSVPVFDEVILSLNGLSNIRSFDSTSGILTADAGCILQSLDEFVKEKGYIVPLDLGAKGSCQIGGNVATNAGGLRLLRYGSLHGSVLGLEVVLPDENGTVLSSGMKTGLRKDNTGYDLKQLFIGSEGTLGIITGVCILTPKRSSSMKVALLSVSDYQTIQKVYNKTRESLGEILSAFEFFDQDCFELVMDHTKQKDPFEGGEVDGKKNGFYVLIETSGSNEDHDDQKLNELLESLIEDEIIKNGVLAQDQTQFQSIWSLREQIPESIGKFGKTYKYDVSLPIGKMYELVLKTRKRFDENGLMGNGMGDEAIVKAVVGYGHLGDGNLHLNIVTKEWNPQVERLIEPWIYEWISNENGSISAEHGLGLMKSPYIKYSKDSVHLDLMKSLKNLLDPVGILNPNKYFV